MPEGVERMSHMPAQFVGALHIGKEGFTASHVDGSVRVRRPGRLAFHPIPPPSAKSMEFCHGGGIV